MEGLAAASVWLGLAFWGSLAIDWSCELPQVVRGAVLAVAGIGLAVVLFRFILRRAFVRLSNANLATILERQFPQLNDSLLTSVFLLDRPIETSGFNPRMLAHTSSLAQQRLRDVALSKVFNPLPFVRKAVVALGLALAIGLLAVMAPDVLDLWAQRNFLLTNAMWPHKIRLEAVGFTDGVVKVAKGASFDLRVQAFKGDTEIPVVPDKVEIRYRIDGGGRDRKTMKNIGQPATSSAANQVLREYSYPFTGVLSTHHLDIAGGDARLYDLQLKVVPNPNLNLRLVCDYPPYMERGPLTIGSVGGAVPVPVPIGSHLTITGTADKPLEMARVDGPAPESGGGWYREFRGGALGANRNEFTFSFEPFPAPASRKVIEVANPRERSTSGANPAARAPHDCMLQFSLRDADGLKARDPILVNFVPIPDEPPEVKVRLVGTREPVVTPRGRLPVAGTISDDHGLGRAWWAYTVEERTPTAVPAKPNGDSSQKPAAPHKVAQQRSGEVPLAKAEVELHKHLPEYVVKEADDVKASQMSLATGQRLTVAVRAEDLCTFGNGPNVGSSETWQLDVVTEDELVTRLEAQELLVKQRFEQIVEEMVETRNLLLKMNFTPADKAATLASKVRSAGAEPGERPEEAPKFSVEQLNTRRLERTLQALQNCRKNKDETNDVANAIEEIRLQLDNNQANNETRKQRIENHVLKPLRYVVDTMFPLLEVRLLELQKLVDDLSKAPDCRDKAQEQADKILAIMREVLDHMMKTEDFNINVVQRLKKIIESQKKLTLQTEKTEQDSLGDRE